MDAFRIAIAQFLVEALPSLTIEKAIEGVDYGRKEDFLVALPRFRLPEKPAELAQKVISKVSSPLYPPEHDSIIRKQISVCH